MNQAWCYSLLLLGLLGCSSETTSTPSTTSGDANVEVAADAATSDAATPDTALTDTGAPGADVTVSEAGTVSLSGKVTRKAGTKPTAGGKGSLYVALFDGNPITDMKGAKLVGRALIENVDMNPDTASYDYRIDGIPPSSTERQVVAFLDDNKTATTTSPAPDKGDLVTIDIASFSGIKVKVPADTTLNLQLNAAIP